MSKKTKFAVVGRGSEDTLRKYDRRADFSGEQYGIEMEEIAAQFAALADGGTVLIPRAKGSLETIQKALTPETKVINMPVYETVLDDNIDATNAEVLIFTSPSNAEAYFVNNLIEPEQQVICIGRSTAAVFDKMGLSYTLPYSPDLRFLLGRCNMLYVF